MRPPRRRAVTGVTLSVLLLAGFIAFFASDRATAGGPARHAAPVPTFGAFQTVDENDVGDPFILRVPTEVAAPSGLPYVGLGPDAYVSDPWTAATSRAALAHGWYVLFGTTDWQSNVPTAVSVDLVHWTQAPDALPTLPSWAAPSFTMTWAPAAQQVGGHWVLYYSTEEESSGRECIGRALSATPAGPFVDDSTDPLVCQRSLGGSIDPSVVDGPGGSRYLVWKNDGNSAHTSDSIWAAPLAPSGTSLTGAAVRLVTAAQAWEKGIVEAPAMIAASSGGGYWLFYSGGAWNSDAYGTGLARCSTVQGPCQVVGAGPFLATSKAVLSPGGLDTFRDGQGRLWAALTALVEVPSHYHPGRHYFNRVLDIAPLAAG